MNFFDTMEAIKTALLLNVLIPVKRFMLAQPWPLLVPPPSPSPAGVSAGRVSRLSLVGLTLFIALNGQWQNAMETVYLCGISVVIAWPSAFRSAS